MRLRVRHRLGGGALNITPLIDMVFILLVFFMLATNLARFRLIGVDSPEDREVARTAEGAVVIELLEPGSIRVDGRPYPRAALAEAVAAITRIDPNRVFLIRPAPGTTLQETVSAHDDARAGGARQLSFSRHREAGR
ncbi:MAG: ExbD/TolR family protein [Thermaurantiacus tibetensis]|uniref:ExbD/TolR family protein n=1 Tax=Thermaurantiacus tibetensis TaxID=2759035 RepID=UPI00188EDF63|nr:biopolymer transporter ExbD [Thermaurantiacus tibetensis]